MQTSEHLVGRGCGGCREADLPPESHLLLATEEGKGKGIGGRGERGEGRGQEVTREGRAEEEGRMEGSHRCSSKYSQAVKL